MKKGYRRRTAAFKAKVVFEALKGDLPLAALAAKFEVHPTPAAKWKRQVLESGAEIFGSARERCEKGGKGANACLCKTISQLQTEADRLKRFPFLE